MPSTKQATAPPEAAQPTIFIKGARSNNLKNVDLEIPKNQLVVVTGVSGSGKSSITMDTLFAEGQRRYVESLSSYARQFLMRMKKPEVDYIKGICPAIAIEQKVSTANARSTVGTLTEIYDYLRLLYARIGKTHSPISGGLVKKHEVSDVVDYIASFPDGERVQLFIPLPYKYKDRELAQELGLLLQKGYTRMFLDGNLEDIQDFLGGAHPLLNQRIGQIPEGRVLVLIDRFAVRKDDAENERRIADSVQTAFYESEGECLVLAGQVPFQAFNNRFELDGMTFAEPSPQLFNFNNPFGACPQCEGFSMVLGIDEDKVIPDKTRSVYGGAIACWKGEKFGTWLEAFLQQAHHFDFPVHTPVQDLSKAQRRLLWTGNAYFQGIHAFFKELEDNLYKVQNRVLLSRYRGKTLCPACEGARLRKEALYVLVDSKNIGELVEMPVGELLDFFNAFQPGDYDAQIGKRLLGEIRSRLQTMCDLGLPYLTLNRISATLSGGETQRINLTRMLGSNLT